MADDSLTVRQFAKWVRAQDALSLVTEAIGLFRGPEEILEHLKGGILRAAAGKASAENLDQEPIIYSLYEIVPPLWNRLAKADFWPTGNAQFHQYDRYNLGQGSQMIRCFDIRFEPRGIREMIQKSTPANTPPATPSSPKIEDPKPKGPAVSPAALDAWLVAYQLAYKDAEDTLARAYDSAEGMFPGKFVSRQRIRDLLKGRKPGRKRG